MCPFMLPVSSHWRRKYRLERLEMSDITRRLGGSTESVIRVNCQLT